MTHRETQGRNIQFPRCGKLPKHAGNLKQHQSQEECGRKGNEQQRNGEEAWGGNMSEKPNMKIKEKQVEQKT